ncbi:MAG: hypothetical protein Q8K32_02320 [Archangium sp.]|nr:hypothetical protein [Archangium sp.]
MKTISIIAALGFLSCGSSYGGARCRGIEALEVPAQTRCGFTAGEASSVACRGAAVCV